MKKIIVSITILLGGLVAAQSGNVFQDAAKQQEDNQYETQDAGGPGDPVPIDDYLPFLAVAGAALAVYALRKKQVAA